jgi:hypothetical protein
MFVQICSKKYFYCGEVLRFFRIMESSKNIPQAFLILANIQNEQEGSKIKGLCCHIIGVYSFDVSELPFLNFFSMI